MAHIGVLDVLSKAGIQFQVVSGCSVGSVMGALYCAGYSLDEIRAAAPFIHWKKMVKRARETDKGLLNFDKLERLLVMMLGEIDFSDLDIPFAVVTMDFETGERVVCKEGPVAQAVHASCSVPGIFEPVYMDGRFLVDGGVVDNLPVDLARNLGADYVVGVDIFKPHYQRDWGVLGVGLTVLETLIHNSGGGVGRADFLIRPDTAGMTYVRFSKYKQLIAAGEEAAASSLPDLVADLRLREEDQ
jgi:NTE family protein